MSVSASQLSRASTSDAVLVDLFEDIAAKVQAGEPVDLEAYARAHPEQAEPLRRLLPTIHVLADLGRSAAKGILRWPPCCNTRISCRSIMWAASAAHFYAMQSIEGQTVAAVIHDL
jgi:hypothetical protein